jgi:hypothetical protein
MFDSVLYDTMELDDETDAFGITWCVLEVEGWWDTPPLDQEVLQPTAQDRGAVAASNLSPRTMILRGTAKRAPDSLPDSLMSAMDRLAAKSWPLLSQKSLTITEGGTARTTEVLPAGALRRRQRGLNQYIYEVPLIAEDPRKYSVTVQSEALPDTVVNGGSFPTDPVITLTDGGDYVLTNTTQGAGAILTVTGAPAGAVVDMRARTVTQGGVDYYATVDAASVWWTLLPGSNVITKTGGAADISWRDAWL